MPSDTFEQLLEKARAICGIDPGFWDIWGKYHETTPDAKQSILRAKGFDATDAASLKRSLDRHARAQWERLLPESLVLGEAEPVEAPISVRADALGERAQFQVRTEGGELAAFELKLWDLPAASSIDME